MSNINSIERGRLPGMGRIDKKKPRKIEPPPPAEKTRDEHKPASDQKKDKQKREQQEEIQRALRQVRGIMYDRRGRLTR